MAYGSSGPVRPLRYYWLICIFAPYGQCFPVSSELECASGYYANSTEPPTECLPCSTCEIGQGVRNFCNLTHNTGCEDCEEGVQWSNIGNSGRQCDNCSVCEPSRSEVSPCTSTEDAKCGECAPNYFLYIDSSGSECLKCSACPEDRVVIHWIECAEAGLPPDQQCAPGEVAPTNTTHSENTTTATSASPTSGSEAEPPSTIATDRGGFITGQSEPELLTTSPPTETVGIAVSIVSLVFTAATLCIFAGAFLCIGWRYCQLRCKSMSHLQMQRRNSADQLLPDEDSATITRSIQPEQESPA